MRRLGGITILCLYFQGIYLTSRFVISNCNCVLEAFSVLFLGGLYGFRSIFMFFFVSYGYSYRFSILLFFGFSCSRYVDSVFVVFGLRSLVSFFFCASQCVLCQLTVIRFSYRSLSIIRFLGYCFYFCGDCQTGCVNGICYVVGLGVDRYVLLSGLPRIFRHLPNQ